MLVLLLSMMLETLFLVSVKAESRTWTVDDDGPADFSKIQDAINAASPGDVISVASGIYYENVVIGTSLTLAGAGDSTTFIHGERTETGIEIVADNVNISGFTILNCENGIKISSNGNTVNDNTINLNIFAGIYVEFLDDNTLSGNMIASNEFGIYLRASSKNKISGNTISNNNFTGISMESQSSSNFINNNTITSNSLYGVRLYPNSTKNIFSNNLMSNSDTGIVLEGSSDNVIRGNRISNNEYHGVDLFESSGNTFTGNIIANNQFGTYLYRSRDNIIYHNNFINNTEQASSINSVNSWDNGAEGNYWSDYNGLDTDGDGLGDILVPHAGVDEYPLMDPWSFFRVFNITTDGKTYIVTTSSNSTIASFIFNQSLQQISFNVTGPSGTLGFCNVTIPKNLLNSEPPKVWTVTINGINTTFSSTENSTHTSLQFTYGYSTHGVQIRLTELQNIPPIANFTYSPIDPTFYDTIDFNDTSTDSDGEIASWNWNFGDGDSSTDQNPSYRYANAGKYVVTLTVEDDLNATTVTSKVVSVRKVRTTLNLDAPSTAADGEPFTITAILRDENENPLPQAMIEFYLFKEEKWEKIASAETNSSGVAPITYTSSQILGTHRFKAIFLGTQIFAESSSTPAIKIVTIIDVSLPEADAGPDQSVRVGTPVIFNANGSSDNVGIVSYEWDFGDGVTGTGVTVIHTYTEPGTYTVTLTVRDAADNSGIDTIIVIVKADSSFPMWIVSIIVATGIITVAGLFIWKRKGVDKQRPDLESNH